MKLDFDTFAPIGVALALGAAGIAGLIDANTMIVLVVLLVCCLPNRRACRPDPRDARR